MGAISRTAVNALEQNPVKDVWLTNKAIHLQVWQIMQKVWVDQILI